MTRRRRAATPKGTVVKARAGTLGPRMALSDYVFAPADLRPLIEDCAESLEGPCALAVHFECAQLGALEARQEMLVWVGRQLEALFRHIRVQTATRLSDWCHLQVHPLPFAPLGPLPPAPADSQSPESAAEDRALSRHWEPFWEQAKKDPALCFDASVQNPLQVEYYTPDRCNCPAGIGGIAGECKCCSQANAEALKRDSGAEP
jgi:hypothetical protein